MRPNEMRSRTEWPRIGTDFHGLSRARTAESRDLKSRLSAPSKALALGVYRKQSAVLAAAFAIPLLIRFCLCLARVTGVVGRSNCRVTMRMKQARVRRY